MYHSLVFLKTWVIVNLLERLRRWFPEEFEECRIRSELVDLEGHALALDAVTALLRAYDAVESHSDQSHAVNWEDLDEAYRKALQAVQHERHKALYGDRTFTKALWYAERASNLTAFEYEDWVESKKDATLQHDGFNEYTLLSKEDMTWLTVGNSDIRLYVEDSYFYIDAYDASREDDSPYESWSVRLIEKHI